MPDTIIYDSALGQYVMGVRWFNGNLGVYQIDLFTSSNPLDFSPSHGGVEYDLTDSINSVYPAFIGDPNSPELQANSDGSFYLYYEARPQGGSIFGSTSYIGRLLVTLGTTTSGGGSGWTQCAAENETCSFSGSMTVAYGANGHYYYKTLSNDTACGNGVFGDPITGTVKACYTSALPPNGVFTN